MRFIATTYKYVLILAICLLTVLGCNSSPGPEPIEEIPNNPDLFGAVLPSKAEVDQASHPLLIDPGTPGSSVLLTTDTAMPPIGNQGYMPSCTAWAVGYGLCTFEVAKASGRTSSSESVYQASPADLYSKTLQAQGYGCRNGTHPKVAMELLVHRGVRSAAEMPYSDKGCINPSPSGNFGIKGFNTIQPQDTQMIKLQLERGHPIAFGAETYDDFESWGRGINRTGVYHGSGRVAQGQAHAMLIVGYDDGRQAWRVMNSWGTGWGDNGFFWMSYQTFNRTAAVAYVADSGGANDVPPPTGGSVTFSSLTAVEYVDYIRGYAYLLMPFQMSEPVFVVRGRISHVETNQTTGWAQINQWGWSNYVWLALYQQRFIDGTYKLEFEGRTRDGRNVTVTGQARMSRYNRPVETYAFETRERRLGPVLQGDKWPTEDKLRGTAVLFSGVENVWR